MEMNHFQSECAGPLYSRNVHYPGSQMDAHISTDMLSSAQSTYSLSQNADDVAHGQLVHSVSTCSLSSEGVVVKAEPQEINGSNGVCMEVAVFEPGVGDSSSSASNRATCQVCGDKASGFHYGVTSCEGCKGFFRRSMSKQNDYRCLRGKGCQVMRTNRNRCQFCRFMKCLSVGMSRDSVRYGRVPKQPVSYEDQPVSSTGILELNNRQSEDALKRAKYEELHEIIMTLSHVHVLYCDETGDKVAAMEKIHSSLLSPPEVPNHQTQLPLNEIEACRCLMFQNAALLVNPTMYQVVEFAKRIPDFHLVSQDDQLTLIKSSFFEVCLVRTARLYDPVNGNVLFSSGGRIIRKAELEVVYGKALVDGMFDFAQRFTQFNLTDTEVGLVTCLILTNSDQPGVIDRETVKIIHNKLRDALHMLTAQTHPQEQTLFRSIIDQLPTLRDLNRAYDQQLEWYRSRWRHLHLPPLYAEIFDMPRPDDESENNESENQ